MPVPAAAVALRPVAPSQRPHPRRVRRPRALPRPVRGPRPPDHPAVVPARVLRRHLQPVLLLRVPSAAVRDDDDVRPLVAVVAAGEAHRGGRRALHRAEPRAALEALHRRSAASRRFASRRPSSVHIDRLVTRARAVMNPDWRRTHPRFSYAAAVRGPRRRPPSPIVGGFLERRAPRRTLGASKTSRSTTTMPSSAMRIRSSMARSSDVPLPLPPSLNMVCKTRLAEQVHVPQQAVRLAVAQRGHAEHLPVPDHRAVPDAARCARALRAP